MYAIIDNGGEAQALSIGPSPLTTHVEVGTNDGAGTLSVDGRSVAIGSDLDVGEIVSKFARGPNTVSSNGTVTINHCADLFVRGVLLELTSMRARCFRLSVYHLEEISSW